LEKLRKANFRIKKGKPWKLSPISKTVEPWTSSNGYGPEIVNRLRGSGVTLVGLDELPDVPGLRVEPQIVGKR
jgi:hypothetical protein